MDLRYYQQDAVDQIREQLLKGVRKILLVAPTGAGKTVIFCYIVSGAKNKGKKILIVVKGRELVKNASDRLIRENVDHGVYMSNHYLFNPSKPVQVCSIDTIRARKVKLDADVIILDEAHFATSKSYKDFLDQYCSSTCIIAVTATPFVKKGLKHVANSIVEPVKINELIEKGFLVPPRYFPPHIPDLKNITISSSTGDYNQSELSNLMDKADLVGDIVSNWIEKGEERATICFAIDVKHSKHIAEQFNEKGIPARHIDAKSSDIERENALQDLKDGVLKVVTNVGILTVGVDMPYVSCIIMARPTLSLNLFIQSLGRGTRPCPEIGKIDFLVFDHAGNTHTHGFLETYRKPSLEPIKKKKSLTAKNRKVRKCEECKSDFFVIDKKCENCGWVVPNSKDEKEIIHLEHLKLVSKELSIEEKKLIETVAAFKRTQKLKNYKPLWVHYQIRKEFGEEVADRVYPHPYKMRFGHYPKHIAS